MIDWRGKRVMVTGAAGFIGSHLCEQLLDLGATVTAMIRYSSVSASAWGNLELLSDEHRTALRVVAGTVEDSGFVRRAVEGQEIIFHLAALIAIPYSYSAPASYVRTNIEGTLNMLEAARAAGVERLIHTSTSEVYGTARYTPIDEQHPLQGQSPYSASKIGADKLAESYFLSFGLPVATIRPFNTFGPRQSARAVLPTIISQALTLPELRLGALDPVRDLTYVKDMAAAFVSVAESDQAIGTVTNFGNGAGISIGDLAQQVLQLLGMSKPVELDAERLRPAASEVYTLICDNGKARAITGWQPRYTLQEGLSETIAFIDARRDLYRPVRYAL